MKRFLAYISLGLILACGIYAVVFHYVEGTVTYDGSYTNVMDLYSDPENVDMSHVNGVADVIVQENLSKTEAANNVAAVVYDFRGFDTLGESFILLTAIAGSYIVLKSVADGEKETEEDKKGEEA
ncbi:MAG: hypothetical protein K6E33_00415 [Lachnospiraceae bacterium]|nr:hypothetical protein [Lachnospiraceae bacterium]